MKILIADAFDKALPGRLAGFGEVFDDVGRLAEADVLLVRSKTKVTADLLASAPALKLVIRGGVGTDNIDKPACKERGIKVVNTPKASSVAVAELAMALMIAVPNRLVEAHNAMKEGRFLKSEIKRTELFRKTLGILGVGLIGSEVAKRAAAFGMRVIGHDPFVASHPLVEMKPLDEVLAAADYLSIHTPLTDETKGMLNKARFDAMKQGVVIVNTGRGKVVVEEDLAEALRSGKVAAYATDVWYSDPPDPSCPLLTAPNVLMTPHIGASSRENLGRIGDEVVQILGDWK
ncbi:MAG: hydroxyacid dehydrogenase [Deltaproteobacteria bacterium]|nr:hydroxyacid dehydrogenase [Deltaproteobacteria bacterium]